VKRSDVRRGNSSERLYDWGWHKASRRFLDLHPLCVDCQKDGVFKVANVVDHDPPHKGDLAKFWDRSTWFSRCKRHHDIKTATRDGGFGHQ